MVRKTAFALLVVLVVSQVAGAGTLRCVFEPVEPDSPAKGTLQIGEGKPGDNVFRVHMSVSGLEPGAPHSVRVFESSNLLWELQFFADENGSSSVKGTVRGDAVSKLMSGKDAVIMHGMWNKPVMTGKLK